MDKAEVQKIISNVFNSVAKDIESGVFKSRVRVGITATGNDYLVNNIVKAAETITNTLTDCDIVLIGKRVKTDLENIEVPENEVHSKMEQLLNEGNIDACITSNYNFPIGVATIGRVVTPARGREMFIASTTGSLSANRIEAMIKNAVYGISTAKACGIKNPTLGILNVDGALKVEKALMELKNNGYDINFARSFRNNDSCIMRGNDLLIGTPDVMVQDTLTGNMLIKIFSSFSSGGDYEAVGYGYGPGLSEVHKRNILIISRLSGIPVISNALKYAVDLVHGKIASTLRREIDLAKKANLNDIIKISTREKDILGDEISPPSKEVVNTTIVGIDILDLDVAIRLLWRNGIYGESGMGCVGPVIMLNDEKKNDAIKLLKGANYLG